MERYSVYEGHMEDLMKKVNRIRNKCMKYGCDFHFAEVGEEIKEVKDLEGHIHHCRFVLVEVEGTAVINDWLFVASVEHTENGNIFSKALTDVEIPDRYRTSKSVCEHCNSNRTRSATFIIMNTVTGEFKQVGKSCLMDFTNGLSASTAAYFVSLKHVFEEAEEAPVSCGRGESYWDTMEILTYAAETIRKFGYVKSNNDYSTKERTMDIMMVDKGMTRWVPESVVKQVRRDMEKVNFNAKSPEAKEMVNAALAWIADQEASNDYMHNLKVASSLNYANWNRIGILISLFPTFNRELEIQARKKEAEAKVKKEAQTSNHVGSVGDRIQINVQSVKCLTSWENTFTYYPTTTYLYKIVDQEGNVFTWKTANVLNEDEPPVTIKGTVKEHSEFRGVKQTVLTRCKVA